MQLIGLMYILLQKVCPKKMELTGTKNVDRSIEFVVTWNSLSSSSSKYFIYRMGFCIFRDNSIDLQNRLILDSNRALDDIREDHIDPIDIYANDFEVCDTEEIRYIRQILNSLKQQSIKVTLRSRLKKY